MALCLDKKVEVELRSIAGNNVRPQSAFNLLLNILFLMNFMYRFVAIAMQRFLSGHLSRLEFSCAWNAVEDIVH